MMNKAGFYILLLFSLAAVCWLGGCRGHQNYDNNLTAADELMKHDVDSALATLSALQPSCLTHDADRAYHALLLTEARYRCYIPATSDSLINVALDYYERHGEERDKLTRAYIYKGAVMEELGENREAMQYYKTALSQVAADDYFNQGYIRLRIGNIYRDNLVADSADITMFKEALNYFEQAPDSFYMVTCLAEIGSSYGKNNLDSVLHYLYRADTLATTLHADQLRAINRIFIAEHLMYSRDLKEVDKDIIDPANVGDTLNYTVTATNTGNVTLHEVAIIDELIDAYDGFTYEWDGEEGTLLPGEKVVAKAEYKITQADIDNASVANTALAKSDKTDPQNSTVITELVGVPSISLTKVFDVEGALADAKAGDKVPVKLIVKNDGGVTLKVIEIKEALKVSDIVFDWEHSSDESTEEGILAVGETVTAACVYTVTQKDIDNAHVDNKATVYAEAVTPDKTPVESTGEDKLEIEHFSKLSIKKTADTTVLKDPKVGTPIAYTIKVTNEGNTTLTKSVINDKLEGISKLTYQWEGKEGVLLPGESVTATCIYKLTADDIKAGKVTNVAVATGENPDGDPVTSEEVSVTTTITQTPAPDAKTSTPASNPTTTASTPTNVKTGDPLPIVGGMAAVAIALAAVLFVYKKRRA